MTAYEKPAVVDLGSVHDLTLTPGNKIGSTPDIYSLIVPIIGSIVPVQ